MTEENKQEALKLVDTLITKTGSTYIPLRDRGSMIDAILDLRNLITNKDN